MSQLVNVAREGDVGIISLDDPERGNAISQLLARQLAEAIRECAANRSIRVVLLKSKGKIFCAGGDLAEFQRERGERAATLQSLASQFHEAERLLLELDVPLICAVQGAAAGAGLTLALLGDIVIASEEAKFVPGFATLGVSADGGSTWLLPRLIGQRRAAEWLLTGRVLSANEAAGWGLVSEVCSASELVDRSMVLAKRLASGPTPAFGSIKRLVRQSLESSFTDQTRCEALAIAHHAETPNGEEGVQAFLERRQPQFTGRECSDIV